MSELLPPAPIGVPDPQAYVWKDWFEKLRRVTNNNQTAVSITLSPLGFIQGGQTGYNTGNGFFLGYSGGAYKFSVGNSSGQYLTYDGTSLYYNGALAPATVGNDQLLADAVEELNIAAGAVAASKLNVAAIDSSSGNLAVNSVTTANIQTNAITADKVLAGSITSDKLTVNTLSAISANLGTITSGSISGITITGSLFRTAVSGQRVEIDSSGITLSQASSASPYGTVAKKYGDATNTYGSGVLAYINNATKTIPFYINSEQAVADIHLYNRSADPIGTAEIGDLAVVSGELKICTSAGTPGTWTVVGTQT